MGKAPPPTESNLPEIWTGHSLAGPDRDILGRPPGVCCPQLRGHAPSNWGPPTATDAFVYNSAQRSYQQILTYEAVKYRAAKDVMALASRGSSGGSSRKEQTSTGPQGLSVYQLHSLWEEDDTAAYDTDAVRRLPRGSARPEVRPMFGGRPRRVPRCATCVGRADTGSLIARF